MGTPHRDRQREDEERVVSAVVSYLQQVSGNAWHITGREVPVGDSGKNFDFEISDGHTKVAVEVTQYVEDPEKPVQDAQWPKFMNAVEQELLPRGYNGLMISTYGPKSASSKKSFQKDAQAFADRVVELVGLPPSGNDMIRFGDHSEGVTYIPNLDGIHSGYHTLGSGPPASRAHDAIVSALDRKREQLNVDYGHRCLALDIRGGVAGIEEFRSVAAALTNTELHPISMLFAVFGELAELIDDRGGLAGAYRTGTEPEKHRRNHR